MILETRHSTTMHPYTCPTLKRNYGTISRRYKKLIIKYKQITMKKQQTPTFAKSIGYHLKEIQRDKTII